MAHFAIEYALHVIFRCESIPKVRRVFKDCAFLRLCNSQIVSGGRLAIPNRAFFAVEQYVSPAASVIFESIRKVRQTWKKPYEINDLFKLLPDGEDIHLS